MTRPEDLTKWKAALTARLPVVGTLRRKWAMAALESQRNEAEVVPLLIQALDGPEAAVTARANAALSSLTSGQAVDRLCALWAQKRDERLGQIIAQRTYVASGPAQVHVLSGLKAGTCDVLSQGKADLVGPLVTALTDAEPEIQRNALTVLQGLQNQEAVDALCALWAQQRDERLGQIIAQRKYVASQPLQLKILTAFKCGRQVTSNRADVIPYFVTLLDDADSTVSAGATRFLEELASGSAQDALCEEAMKNPGGAAAKLCVRTRKRPSDHERACLFLFLTRQFDEYLKEDYEFQNVRMELQRADAALRASIMEVYRSGDNRILGLIEAKPKTLGELSDAELRHFIELCTRHRDWARLFQASLRLPLKYSLAALASFRQSQWEPESADLRSIYRQILADTGDQPPSPAKQPSQTSSLFEQWLARGTRDEWSKLAEGELCKRLATASPPDGVAIVAALAAKQTSSSAAVKTVKQNSNWLIRLAGHAAGLLSSDLIQDTVQDSNYWITELVSAAGVLEYWPGKSAHADIEALKTLSAAPPEAWAGKLGAARKVLQAILSYGNTGIVVEVVEDVVVGPREYDVVVEDAE